MKTMKNRSVQQRDAVDRLTIVCSVAKMFLGRFYLQQGRLSPTERTYGDFSKTDVSGVTNDAPIKCLIHNYKVGII